MDGDTSKGNNFLFSFEAPTSRHCIILLDLNLALIKVLHATVSHNVFTVHVITVACFALLCCEFSSSLEISS